MEGTLLYIALFSFLLLFLLRKMLSTRMTPNLPPSPPSLPIIGHLHLLKQPLHRTLHKLSKQYGPIINLYFGSRPVTLISSPSAIEECFTKNDIIFANRPRNLSGEHFGYAYTGIGAVPYGSLWRNLRRLAAVEILSINRLNTFMNIRKEEILLMVQDLQQEITQHVNEGGFARVKMSSRVQEMSFNVIMRMISGKRYFGEGHGDGGDEEDERKFREIIREVFELSGMTDPEDFFPFLRLVDYNGIEKRMIKVKQKADGIMQRMIDERRKMKESGVVVKAKTMIDSVLSLQDTEPDTYSDLTIKGLILALLSAGTDTSAVSIEWAMSLLINHPWVLEKARNELDNAVAHGCLVDETDLQKLPYLQNIVNEALRLFPPAPLLVPHESSEDTTIGGYHIPAKTMLLVNAWAVHRDPEVWDDPASFKPERFDELKGDDNMAYKFLPFGLGRRGCPGARLANRVVGLALAVLIQCFEWKRESEELVDMSEGTGLTIPKVQPLEALCKVRKPMLNGLEQL